VLNQSNIGDTEPCLSSYRLHRNCCGTVNGLTALKWTDGRIERFKARWVAKGFEQLYGVDYEQTFAPVAKSVAIGILMALAAHHDWEI
jgi:hypothetical protein